MKIEKKYRIDTHQYDITEVNAIIDDKGKLVADAAPDENNFYAPVENELFFDTEGAARQGLASIVPTEEEIKKVLKFLYNAPNKKIEEYDEAIKTVIVNDSLLYKAIYGEGEVYDYFRNNFKRFLPRSIVERIRLLIQQRILNIDGVSVPIYNISHVKWGENDEACKLILKDGTEVFCSEKEGYDLWLVILIFGRNDSGREFINLHR